MKRKAISILMTLILLFSVSGCGAANSAASQETGDAQAEDSGAESMSSTTAGNTSEATESTSDSEMFTDRDLEIGYDEAASAHITLSGDSASSDSDAVQISGSTVTITDEGTYILSGTLDNGMVTVNAGDTDKVQLVLDGVEITSATSAAIYVLEADKVVVTTASGSENTLANGGEYVAIDENDIDAVIFSKADLTLNGSGTLTVSAAAGHGVVSKDDLVLTSGTYSITAASHGLSGNDSVRIASGTYTIDSGKDGIQAENTEDASLGFIYIAGGAFSITAQGDAMSATGDLQIEDGDFTLLTGEGSASVTMETEGARFAPDRSVQTETTTDTVSQKGIKADGTIAIVNGSFVTDTADDSIHAGGDILITSGAFELQSGDDAIHSDAAVQIQDGDFTIAYCYEGIEGLSITIADGSYDITSVDDGLNSAGGMDSSGFGGGRAGQDPFMSGSDGFVTIDGGTFAIVSQGDCIDSNGALTINGGTLDLTCNGSGNTALDCDGTYSNNGGDITTNDGSESNPGQMGGQGGGGRGHGGR